MAIGLDIGSSSIKALRLDGAGRAPTRGSIRTRTGAAGRVEHDAEEIARVALRVLEEMPRGRRDRRLGIATQRSTFLFWDRDTGRPLTPAYSWQDLRGRRMFARLEKPAAARVARVTGLRLSPHYSAAKIAWALRRVPGLARRVARGRALWGTLGSFLVWRWSRGAVYAIDHANAQRTLLFDLDGLGWDPALVDLFGLQPLLEAPCLPALLPTITGEPIPIRPGGLELDLCAWTGDQQAALIGVGCRRPGDVAINYGSGAFVLRHVGSDARRVPGLLTSLLASWRRSERKPGGSMEARFAVEGPVNAATTAIAWAERTIGVRAPIRSLDRLLASATPGPARLHFLPAVAGLGAPRWDPDARPFFAGDLRTATAADRMRAVVASIACRCAEIVRAAGPGRGPVYAAGGLTRCRTLLQIQADLLQQPILVRDLPDATARGAALLAGVGAAALDPPARDRSGAGGGGSVTIRPAIGRAEAEARYRAWEKAVYRR